MQTSEVVLAEGQRQVLTIQRVQSTANATTRPDVPSSAETADESGYA